MCLLDPLMLLITSNEVYTASWGLKTDKNGSLSIDTYIYIYRKFQISIQRIRIWGSIRKFCIRIRSKYLHLFLYSKSSFMEYNSECKTNFQQEQTYMDSWLFYPLADCPPHGSSSMERPLFGLSTVMFIHQNDSSPAWKHHPSVWPLVVKPLVHLGHPHCSMLLWHPYWGLG